MDDVSSELGNMAVPPDAAALTVVAGDAANEAILGRIASDLRGARIATFLLHVDRRDPSGAGVSPERLRQAIEVARSHRDTADLDLGVLAAGRAGSAALTVAAHRPDSMSALVGYNLRLDDVPPGPVRVATLLLVGDEHLLPINQAVLERVQAPKELQVLRAVQRSREEVLERMVVAATAWFGRHLAPRRDYPRDR